MKTARLVRSTLAFLPLGIVLLLVASFGGCPSSNNNSNANDNIADHTNDNTNGGNDNGNANGNANDNNNDNSGTTKSIAEQCAACHSGLAQRYAAGTHKSIADQCLVCHENGRDHMESPIDVPAALHFTLSACAECHASQYDSYLTNDATKAGHFGGSSPTSKYEEFPHYQYLMGGHGFTREYNEERSHAYMLKDHIDTQRRQTTTCLQCKSTPVAYYWNQTQRGELQFAKQMEWAQVIERLRTDQPEAIDYGAGCTHCHDPHTGDFRLIRRGLIEAIVERGTDPYSNLHNVIPESEEALQALMNERGNDGRRTDAAMRLAGILTCAQCHVEYVCGQGADRNTTGEIRDHVPWRRLDDIEAHYNELFGNMQDWTHSITGKTGVKPQHPETEAYWGGAHHRLGLSCADCHMPKGNDGHASHWLTSPLKSGMTACGRCHENAEAELLDTQDEIYATARRIEDLLNTVLQKIEAANTSGAVPADDLDQAKTLYMRALTWWEWTVVSENSMGAHNSDKTREQLEIAESFANQAAALLP